MTLERIIAIVRSELERARAPKGYPDISANTEFERDLRCCAVDLVCISMSIEEQFNVVLPVEVEDCETVADLAELVDRQLAKAAA